MLPLKGLVGPDGIPGFLMHFHRKSRWKMRGEVRAAQTLLPWSELDRLFSERRLSPEQFHIVVNQNHVSPQLYVDSSSGNLRNEAILRFAEQGATFVITGIHDLQPATRALVAEIEQLIGARVQANAYLSFGEQSAFDAHRDSHDVLVIQLFGSKRWRGYGFPEPYPLKGGPFPNRPIEWEDVLEPGDLLYLPRGEVHAAIPVERPSVHLTIGIVERTGVDFVRTLTELAEAQELFRHSLTRVDIPTQESQLKQALHALIDATSLEAFFARDDQERRLKPTAAFNFAQRLEPGTVLAATLLRRIPLHPQIEREIKLVLGGQSIRLTQLERRTLDRLTRCDQATLTELAAALELDPADPSLADALASLASHALVEIVNHHPDASARQQGSGSTSSRLALGSSA